MEAVQLLTFKADGGEVRHVQQVSELRLRVEQLQGAAVRLGGKEDAKKSSQTGAVDEGNATWRKLGCQEVLPSCCRRR